MAAGRYPKKRRGGERNGRVWLSTQYRFCGGVAVDELYSADMDCRGGEAHSNACANLLTRSISE